MNILLILLGAVLIFGGLLQMAFWTATNLRIASGQKKQLKSYQEFLRRRLETMDRSQELEGSKDLRWNGFRHFVVKKIEQETSLSTSVYLEPKDQRPIPGFRPGQHIPIQFSLPGEPNSLVRCYSLSDAPGKEYYRITVKTKIEQKPGEQPVFGKVSQYINDRLSVGDEVELKCPAGDFYLDLEDNRPVVLLSGGVGITPMMSMIETLLETGTSREVLLLYGSRNGPDHIFKNRIETLVRNHSNLSVLNCYSHPVPGDRSGDDYQVKGWVSVDLLKKILPSNNYHFYMCGPPPFISTIYQDLTEWGVSENSIHMEAFGPASVKRKKKEKTMSFQSSEVKVQFTKSGTTVDWTGDHDNLLDAAEDAGLDLDSGCRAGSCGTCEARLVSGTVQYPDGDPDGMEPGMCFPCVAKPASDVTLDA